MEPLPEVLAAMRDWRAVTDDLASITSNFDPEKLSAPSACGHWTNRQLLAHLATGYGVRIAALQAAIASGRAPDIDVDAANAANVERLADAPSETMVAELLRVRGRVLDLLSKLRFEHLDASTSLGGGRTLRDALSGLSGHDLEHLTELRG